MKLKETTMDQRLFAGLVSVIIFVLGLLVVNDTGSKIYQFCGGLTADTEMMTMNVYVVLATIGGGLGVLHLLSFLKFRKS